MPTRSKKGPTVMISSAGRRVGLIQVFRQSLKELNLSGRVLATDMSPLSSAFHSADEAFVVPSCASPEFIPRLLEICESEDVGLVVPTIDTELGVLAAHREAFADIGTTVAVSSPEIVAIASDKVLTHTWLRQAGLPTVDQWYPSGPESHGFKLSVPCIVKPRFGSASMGLRRVDLPEELELLLRDGTDYVVQTIAPGVEFTIDALANSSGDIVCAIPRRRIEVRGGEVSKAVTQDIPTLIDLVRDVCAALPAPPFGPLNVQVFVDPQSGEQNVIELNPRFAGGYPLSWQAGADFPRWMIEWKLGLSSTAQQDGWRAGLVMLRYDGAVFVDEAQIKL